MVDFQEIAEIDSWLQRVSGDLATKAAREMERTLPWYRKLGAQERSWVGQVAQAGIQAFIDWHSNPEKFAHNTELTTDVFGAAPRELTRAISFEQTVDLVRTTINVVETSIDSFVPTHHRQEFREAVLRYSREIAFSAAEVYARAAEARGAWDARLEALVIDALIRDSASVEILSQASALGWSHTGKSLVMAGATPDVDPEDALAVMRRAARSHKLDLLTGIQGAIMFAVIGGKGLDHDVTPRLLTPYFGPGAVVVGSVVTGIAGIGPQARACASGVRAARAWSSAPRPVHVVDLLPERAILGDLSARAELIESLYTPLVQDATLLQTAMCYLDHSLSLEATGRALFVHPNTVRYRLKRITDLTGYDLTNSRDAFAVRLSVVYGLSAETNL